MWICVDSICVHDLCERFYKLSRSLSHTFFNTFDAFGAVPLALWQTLLLGSLRHILLVSHRKESPTTTAFRFGGTCSFVRHRNQYRWMELLCDISCTANESHLSKLNASNLDEISYGKKSEFRFRITFEPTIEQTNTNNKINNCLCPCLTCCALLILEFCRSNRHRHCGNWLDLIEFGILMKRQDYVAEMEMELLISF